MNNPAEFFHRVAGRWQGRAKTWFEPTNLADESEVFGEFRLLKPLDMVRHEYTGSFQGKPRMGDETIAYNAITSKFQTAWVDSFHMNYAIMFSQGDACEHGFSVFGTYDTALGQPPWGWRTVYELPDDHHLNIVAYNVSPAGEEVKAVETLYTRV